MLTNKTDAAGQPASFTYYGNGYPKTRLWAPGVASTNVYDNVHGELVRIDYSDGSSDAFADADFPGLNRQAKPLVVIDAAGTNYLTYDHAGRLLSTYCTNGLLAGITVTSHFNPVYGRDALKVLGPSWAMTNTYGYDGYGRMATVANGIYAATYGYLPGSDLLQTTTCKSNTTTVLTTTRTWETGPRLRSIANMVNGAPITSHSYLYDSLDRRIQATLEDGSLWKYNYNDRNELVGANRYWSDWSPVAGQQYGYDYDNIGNRLDARSGGDTNGWNLRTALYTVNNLNQYTNVANPGYASITGAALATNGVTVNGGTADRKGEYFHDEISVANGSGPLWQSVSVISGGSTTNGGCALPANSQILTYDADGNLTFDGTWTYQWDCLNRLVAMTMTNNIAGLANSNRLKLEFVYDYLSRRTAKTVRSWNGSGFASPVTTLFVYDGWNLLAELSNPNAVLGTYTWGLDLSRTMNRAGGVGGFLMAAISGTNAFTTYDANGNITALINAANKTTSARYEYSPFGEVLRVTGPMAKANPFRFSTKFADDESGLVYYGFRYYSPSQGRWVGRDSAGEDAALCLFLFCHNNGLNGFDTDGRFEFVDLMVSMLNQGFIQGLSGAAISASFAIVRKEFLNDGTWGDVAKAGVEGFATGFFMGPLRKLADGLQASMGLGEGMVFTELASGFSKGLRGMISMAGGAGINSTLFGDDKAIRALRKNPMEQLGIGFAVGMVAGIASRGVSESGAWNAGTDADAIILNFCTDAAGKLGLDAAENIWSVATTVSASFY